MKIKKIISFDPGSLKNIGWARIRWNKNLICSAGTIVIPHYEERWQVYWPMFQEIDAFLAKEKPHLVVIEETSRFGSFVGGQVSQCIGVIYAICGKYKLNIETVYPTSVKAKVAGHGRATKSQVKKSVKQMILDLTHKEVKYNSEHAYDAMANILYYLIREKRIEPLTV